MALALKTEATYNKLGVTENSNQIQCEIFTKDLTIL